MMALRPEPIRGIYEDEFWRHVRDRSLRLQRCEECGHYMYPPAPRCANCLSDRLPWAPVRGRGRIVSWVRFHRTYFPSLPAPYLVAAVELEEGPILIADLKTDAEPRIGDAAHLVYDADGGYPIYHWAVGKGGNADVR